MDVAGVVTLCSAFLKKQDSHVPNLQLTRTMAVYMVNIDVVANLESTILFSSVAHPQVQVGWTQQALHRQQAVSEKWSSTL